MPVYRYIPVHAVIPVYRYILVHAVIPVYRYIPVHSVIPVYKCSVTRHSDSCTPTSGIADYYS